jgi:hypothetical protein
MSCERSIFRSNVSANQHATLFYPEGLMGEHEKGDLDEGHVIHQKWSGVRYKVWGVYFNYEERLLGEIIIKKIN